MKERIYRMNSISDLIPATLDLQFQMCGTTFPNPNYRIYRPNSTVCCLEYVSKGMGHITANGVSFTARAGDTYLLWQGMHQDYFSDKKDPWEKHWVNLSGTYISQLAQSFGIAGVSHFPNVNIQDLLLQFQSIAQHAEREDAHEKCVAILSKAFLRLAESLHPTPKRPRSAVQSILLYIEHHETESIRIEELATLCQKSPSQIERLFSAEMGIPIYRYILNRKLELAKQLLSETGMTVREIAAFLSFEDQFYFSGLFRRKTGYSPTQYRAMSREQARSAASHDIPI